MGSVAAWARGFVAGGQNDTSAALKRIMDTIRDTFQYQAGPAKV
jgi:hypothetical protein